MTIRRGADGWLQRHEDTDKAAQAIIDQEAAKREAKTFRLREARMRRTATFYLPVVSRENFPALEALLHTKKNYSDWLLQAEAWQTYAKSQGHLIQQVRVDPERFRRYLDQRGFPYTREQLLGFAEWCGKS
jgi:hypothetical protein